MGFGSFAVGWNQQGEREQNRRQKMIQFVNEYRRLNPHATADELTGVIESMTGGANHWLRGALPSPQQIKQIGEQNQAQKKQLELLNKAQAYRAQQTIADTATSVFDRIAVDESNPAAAMQKMFETLGVEDEQEQQILSSAIGDPAARRQKLISDRTREGRAKALAELARLDELGLLHGSKAIQQLLPNMPPEVLKAWEEEYAQQKKAKEARRASELNTLVEQVVTDPTLIDAVATGKYIGNEEMLRSTVASRLGPLAEDPKAVEQAMQTLVSNADRAKQGARAKRVEDTLPIAQEEYKRLMELQKHIMTATASGKHENVASAMSLISGPYLLDDQQLAALPGIVEEMNEDYGDEPPSQIAETIKKRLGPLKRKQNSVAWSLDQANQAAGQPMTETDFEKLAMSNVETIASDFDKEVDSLRKDMISAKGSSETHQRQVQEAAFSLFAHTKAQLEGQLEDLEATRANPMEHIGGIWSENAGAQAEAAIQAELERMEDVRRELLQGVDSMAEPAVEPQVEEEPPIPGRRTRRGAPPAGIPWPEQKEHGGRRQRREGLSSAIPDTKEARQIGEAIEIAVQKYGLPQEARALMYAMAETESSFTLGAKNKSGAHGPFQFMPETAKDYGLSDPTNAMAAADATARKLIDARRRQRGNWFDAAVAHHSGNAWSRLGPAGLDYTQKLAQRYHKYLNT